MLGTSFSRSHLDVERVGFHMFDGLEDAPLVPLAAQLDHPVASAAGRPRTDLLLPQIRDESQPGSSSSIHGIDAFYDGKARNRITRTLRLPRRRVAPPAVLAYRMATGLTGEPVPPATLRGLTVSMKS